MFRRGFGGQANASGLLSSRLYDQDTFYEAFIRDLGCCRDEVIIESPFITGKKMPVCFPFLAK
jgi:hypothetical protein